LIAYIELLSKLSLASQKRDNRNFVEEI